MDFSVLLTELRDVAEKYKGRTSDPEVASHAYADMFTQILKKTQNMTESYEDQITMFRVALNQLASIYKDLAQGTYRELLINYIFGMCARTVLNIQWSQLDEDDQVKTDFVSTVETAHESLKAQGYTKFQLILDLMESQWTDPTLTQIMASPVDDEEIEDGEEYIKRQDPEILKLRIEIMMKENCEEFALNLCDWSLKHPQLKNDLKIREHQIVILYKQADYTKMQEVCSKIVCHDGIHLMGRLAKNIDLCIRLAQVFLIQDWINPDRNCCTQELLKLWIHHQYLADKDQERFLDSIWTVAKVCRTTRQIGVLIDGVKGECGDRFIQLYTELCKYALNIDKGNMEQEEAKGNKGEVENRKKLLSLTCVRMAHMLKEYDFKMSRICGLTAFSLHPTSENLNLVNKLYWTIKHTSVTSGNSKINPATVYEVERLLGLMRPEILNPEFTWKQLIPLCKRFQLTKGFKDDKSLVKSKTTNPTNKALSKKPNILSAMPQTKTPITGTEPSTKVPQKKTEESPKSLQRVHAEQLLAQNKQLSHEKVSQIAREKFPKSKDQDLPDGPPLTAKNLGSTIDDLKKSIVLENHYSANLAKHLSPLAIKEGENKGKVSNESHSNCAFKSLPKQSPITTTENQNMNTNSHVTVKTPLPSFSHVVSELHQNSKVVSKTPLQHITAQGSKDMSVDQRPKTQTKGHFNILRPPGSANQECAKIAQQIAEMHEKQRKEKEAIERMQQQNKMHSAKLALNSRNIPSSSQISDLLTLTMKGKSGNMEIKGENDIGGVKGLSKQNTFERSNTSINSNSSTRAVIRGASSGVNSVVQPTQYSDSQTRKQFKTEKFYLATEDAMSRLKRDPSGNINLGDSKVSMKPVLSMVVPKSLTTPDNKQELMKTVTNMMRQVNSKPAPEPANSASNVTGNHVNSEFPINANVFSGHNVPFLNTNTFTSTNQGDMNTQGYSSVSDTNTVYHQSVMQPAIQSQYQNSQTMLNNSINCVTPTQQNSSMSQSGEILMGILRNSPYQSVNNSMPSQSQPGMNLQMHNMQPRADTVQQQYHQQYIQSPLQASHVSQQYLPQQTFSTTPQYDSSPQSGYVPTVYHSQHSVMTGQTLMSPQSDMLQQQLMMPVVHNDISSIQSMPMQPFTMNPSQPTMQIQQSTNVQIQPSGSVNAVLPQVNLNTVVPQMSYSLTSPNELSVAKSAATVQSQVMGQTNSWSMSTGNTGVHPSASRPVQSKSEVKQFIAPPELSPAVVSQILSSLKRGGDGKKDNPVQQSALPVDPVHAKKLEHHLTKEVIRQLAMNRQDAHVRKSVMDATRKILELRKQYENETTSQQTPNKTQGIDLAKATKASAPNVSVPELPDLGSKEFEIDTILRLEENSHPSVGTDVNSVGQSSTVGAANVIQVKSDKDILKQIETFLESDAKSGSAQEIPTQSSQKEKGWPTKKAPQSTYQNANRIAKERETTHLTEVPAKWVKSSNSKVNCRYCQHLFKDNAQLQQHFDQKLCKKINSKTAEKVPMPSCTICGSTFRTLQEMKDHVLSSCKTPGKKKNIAHLSDPNILLVYKCTNCNYMNANEKISIKHVESCSSNVTSSPAKHPASLIAIYRCLMCSDIFIDKEVIYKHVKKLCPHLKSKASQEKAQECLDKLRLEKKLQLPANIASNDKVNRVQQLGEDNSKPKQVQTTLMTDKPLLNGDVQKKSVQSNIVNGEDIKRDHTIKEQDKSGNKVETMTVEEQAELKRKHDLKRRKENFYLEQFREIELKRKALNQQMSIKKEEDESDDMADSFKSSELVLQSKPTIANTNHSQPGLTNSSETPEKNTLQDEIKETPFSNEVKVNDVIPNKKQEVVDHSIEKAQSYTRFANDIRTRRKCKVIDIRKEKGLRAKRLIKQKRYLIDEMEQTTPDGKKFPDKKDTPEVSKQNLNKAPSGVKDNRRKCKLCSFEPRKKDLMAKHYIERHDLGFRAVRHSIKCKFCIFKIPDTNKMKMKSHIIDSHMELVMKQIVDEQLDIPSPMKDKGGTRGSPLTRYSAGKTPPCSPGKSDKAKKHLKALALRKKCAENLQKIALEKLQSPGEDSNEKSFMKDEQDVLLDKSSIKSEKVLDSSRATRNRIRIPDHEVSYNNFQSQRRDNQTREAVTNETSSNNSSRSARSRSSSRSSRSSVNDGIQSGSSKAITSNVGKIMLTRSGRKIMKPETDSSYVTESSNVEDEEFGLSDDEDNVKVVQQKRKRPRRSSRCSERRLSTEEYFSSESSDDGTIPRFTRPAGIHSRGLRRSLRDKAKKEETSTTKQRDEKGNIKGKGSRQDSISDDEYPSSATDIIDIYDKQVVTSGKTISCRTTSTKHVSDIDQRYCLSESDDEAEKSYSLRRRKQSTVYRDYESSDIDESDNSSSLKRGFDKGKPTESLFTGRRKSPRRCPQTDGMEHDGSNNARKANIPYEEKHNLSVLVGPDDDEFVGLNDSPCVQTNVIDTSVATDVEDDTSDTQDHIEHNETDLKKDIAIMESEEEFAFLKSKVPISDRKKEVRVAENTKDIGFNTEFQKFTTQRKSLSDNELSESDFCEEGSEKDTKLLSSNKSKNEGLINETEDVPVLGQNADFVSAFQKFAQSTSKTCTDMKNLGTQEQIEIQCKGFQGAFQHFFDNQNSRKQTRLGNKLDFRRKYGIVDCYVKLFRLEQMTIESFRNGNHKEKSSKKRKGHSSFINRRRSLDTDDEYSGGKVNLQENSRRSKQNRRTSREYVNSPNDKVARSSASDIQNAASISPHSSAIMEKLNRNGVDSIENDPEYVWIENAESVAEQPVYESDIKLESSESDYTVEGPAQQIVILTEPNEEDPCNNPNVVELCITDTAEGGLDNIITIVDDSGACDGNVETNDLESSNIVFIEVQEDEQVIIAHAVDDLDKMPEQIDVVFAGDKTNQEGNVLKEQNDLNTLGNSDENELLDDKNSELIMTDNANVDCKTDMASKGNGEVESASESENIDHLEESDGETETIYNCDEANSPDKLTKPLGEETSCSLSDDPSSVTESKALLTEIIFEKGHSFKEDTDVKGLHIESDTNDLEDLGIVQSDTTSITCPNTDENIGMPRDVEENMCTVMGSLIEAVDSTLPLDFITNAENEPVDKQDDFNSTIPVTEIKILTDSCIPEETPENVVSEKEITHGNDITVESLIDTSDAVANEGAEIVDCGKILDIRKTPSGSLEVDFSSKFAVQSVEEISDIDANAKKVLVESNEKGNSVDQLLRPSNIDVDGQAKMLCTVEIPNSVVGLKNCSMPNPKFEKENGKSFNKCDGDLRFDSPKVIGNGNHVTNLSSTQESSSGVCSTSEYQETFQEESINASEAISFSGVSDNRASIDCYSEEEYQNTLTAESKDQCAISSDYVFDKSINDDESQCEDCHAFENESEMKLTSPEAKLMCSSCDDSIEKGAQIVSSNIDESKECKQKLPMVSIQACQLENKVNSIDDLPDDGKILSNNCEHSPTSDKEPKNTTTEEHETAFKTLAEEIPDSHVDNNTSSSGNVDSSDQFDEQTLICSEQEAVLDKEESSSDKHLELEMENSMQEKEEAGNTQQVKAKTTFHGNNLSSYNAEMSYPIKGVDGKSQGSVTPTLKEDFELMQTDKEVYQRIIDSNEGKENAVGISTCDCDTKDSFVANDDVRSQNVLEAATCECGKLNTRNESGLESYDGIVQANPGGKTDDKNTNLTSDEGNYLSEEDNHDVELIDLGLNTDSDALEKDIDDLGQKVAFSEAEPTNAPGQEIVVLGKDEDAYAFGGNDVAIGKEEGPNNMEHCSEKYTSGLDDDNVDDNVDSIEVVGQAHEELEQIIEDKNGLKVFYPDDSECRTETCGDISNAECQDTSENDFKCEYPSEHISMVNIETGKNTDCHDEVTFENTTESCETIIEKLESQTDMTRSILASDSIQKEKVDLCGKLEEDDRISICSDISLISLPLADTETSDDLEIETSNIVIADPVKSFEQAGSLSDVSMAIKEDINNLKSDELRTYQQKNSCLEEPDAKSNVAELKDETCSLELSDQERKNTFAKEAFATACSSNTEESLNHAKEDEDFKISNSNIGEIPIKEEKTDLETVSDVFDTDNKDVNVHTGNDAIACVESESLQNEQYEPLEETKHVKCTTKTRGAVKTKSKTEMVRNRKKCVVSLVESKISRRAKGKNQRRNMKKASFSIKETLKKNIKLRRTKTENISNEPENLETDSCTNTDIPMLETGKVQKEIGTCIGESELLQIVSSDATLINAGKNTATVFATNPKDSISIKMMEGNKKDTAPVVPEPSSSIDETVMDGNEVDQEDEELFKKRMEAMKKARRKTAAAPYESDFNFEFADNKTHENQVTKPGENQAKKVKNSFFIVPTPEASLKTGNSDSKSVLDPVKPRALQKSYEERKTNMRTRSKDLSGVHSVGSSSNSSKSGNSVSNLAKSSKTTEEKIEIFSPHIFTCDSVRKLKRRASLKEAVMSTVGTTVPAVHSSLPPYKLPKSRISLGEKLPLKGGKQSKTCARASYEGKTQKHLNHLTAVKSLVKQEQRDSFNKNPFMKLTSDPLSNSSVKASPSAKLASSMQSSSPKDPNEPVKYCKTFVKEHQMQNKSMTVAKHESQMCKRGKDSRKQGEASSRGTRQRSKSLTPGIDAGVAEESDNARSEIKPDLTDNGRVPRNTKRKGKPQDLEMIFGKRVKVEGQSGDRIASEQVNSIALKPDGTSASPGKQDNTSLVGQCKHGHVENSCESCSNNRRSRTTSPKPLYDTERKTVRHVLHGGKVFEISKGSVTERPIQVFPGEDSVRRRGVSKVDSLSGEEKDTSAKRKNTNLNEYIQNTLMKIKKQRGSSVGQKNWTIKDRKVSSSDFPYVFKKSRR